MSVGEHILQTVQLDCRPGYPRPGDLIEGVIEGTGLPLRQECSTFFGMWTWDYSDIDPEVWVEAQQIMKERVVALHEAGAIRYGSW